MDGYQFSRPAIHIFRQTFASSEISIIPIIQPAELLPFQFGQIGGARGIAG